jgi:hypothetical protein
MNFTQMHDRLRVELLRRIQRGTLSVSLLARQTGFGQSHLSNFLRSKKKLSMEAMDRILMAQQMTIADLQPAMHQGSLWPELEETSSVQVVSHSAALFEAVIRPSAVLSILPLPASALEHLHRGTSKMRQAWQRFVAIRASSSDAGPMEPLVLPNAIVVIDRHFSALTPYRPNRPNLYAVRHMSHLTLRYVDFRAGHLILRPHNLNSPVELIDVSPGESPTDRLVGRVALILNEV